MNMSKNIKLKYNKILILLITLTLVLIIILLYNTTKKRMVVNQSRATKCQRRRMTPLNDNVKGK